MVELLKMLKKVLIFIFIFIYLPLFALAEAQSFFSLYESEGAEALNPVKVWFVTKNNVRIMWMKTLGVFPRASAIPFLGANYVVYEGSKSLGKWGGCPIQMSVKNNPYFEMALGVAKCSNIGTLRISEEFAQLSSQQLDYAYQVIAASAHVKGGMSDHVEVAYAILALADEVGPVTVSDFLSRRCAEAFLGNVDQKNFCLVSLEVGDALNHTEVNNEESRRAVAIKTGIQSWMWMAADESLSKSFWLQWMATGPDSASVSKLRSWGGSYAPYKDARPSMQLLRRNWRCGDLEEINKTLKRSYLNKIDPLVWESVCNGNH